ncbi:MAG: rRNA maturation RNase YbeY [Treponema sp.]|jgi:probable rRNA maturation factor|nr:rRNA maturation RNase YbeY [Treponema sp.]
MNRVEISAEGIEIPPWTSNAEVFIQKVLAYLKWDQWDLSLVFCDNACIRDLNIRFRGKDEATDILSFPLGESIDEGGETRFLPGDLLISLETLKENARYFAVSEDEELRRLLIHGILHLGGFDHASNAETEPMLQFQETIVAELAGERVIP